MNRVRSDLDRAAICHRVPLRQNARSHQQVAISRQQVVFF